MCDSNDCGPRDQTQTQSNQSQVIDEVVLQQYKEDIARSCVVQKKRVARSHSHAPHLRNQIKPPLRSLADLQNIEQLRPARTGAVPKTFFKRKNSTAVELDEFLQVCKDSAKLAHKQAIVPHRAGGVRRDAHTVWGQRNLADQLSAVAENSTTIQPARRPRRAARRAARPGLPVPTEVDPSQRLDQSAVGSVTFPVALAQPIAEPRVPACTAAAGAIAECQRKPRTRGTALRQLWRSDDQISEKAELRHQQLISERREQSCSDIKNLRFQIATHHQGDMEKKSLYSVSRSLSHVESTQLNVLNFIAGATRKQANNFLQHLLGYQSDRYHDILASATDWHAKSGESTESLREQWSALQQRALQWMAEEEKQDQKQKRRDRQAQRRYHKRVQMLLGQETLHQPQLLVPEEDKDFVERSTQASNHRYIVTADKEERLDSCRSRCLQYEHEICELLHYLQLPYQRTLDYLKIVKIYHIVTECAQSAKEFQVEVERRCNSEHLDSLYGLTLEQLFTHKNAPLQYQEQYDEARLCALTEVGPEEFWQALKSQIVHDPFAIHAYVQDIPSQESFTNVLYSPLSTISSEDCSFAYSPEVSVVAVEEPLPESQAFVCTCIEDPTAVAKPELPVAAGASEPLLLSATVVEEAPELTSRQSQQSQPAEAEPDAPISLAVLKSKRWRRFTKVSKEREDKLIDTKHLFRPLPQYDLMRTGRIYRPLAIFSRLRKEKGWSAPEQTAVQEDFAFLEPAEDELWDEFDNVMLFQPDQHQKASGPVLPKLKDILFWDFNAIPGFLCQKVQPQIEYCYSVGV